MTHSEILTELKLLNVTEVEIDEITVSILVVLYYLQQLEKVGLISSEEPSKISDKGYEVIDKAVEWGWWVDPQTVFFICCQIEAKPEKEMTHLIMDAQEYGAEALSAFSELWQDTAPDV